MVNTTYKLTYYSSYGNDFCIASSYPNYKMEIISNIIPLDNYVDCYMFLTTSTYSCTGIFSMSTALSNGQVISFKDYNGTLNVTNVRLGQNNCRAKINKSTYAVLNTASLTRRYVYSQELNDLVPF